MRTKLMLVVTAVGMVMFLPPAVWAQSSGSIAGVVRDTSGAVLPGVTVEGASPALIEKVRTTVTDEQGQYKLVELRPGTYTVTFTLPGFSAVKHEGIELATGFTATVNAELRVGSLQETVTVSGASPIVDIQNVRTQNVLSRTILDALPTSKTIQAFAALTLGASDMNAGHDVGGNKSEYASSLSIHGGRNADQALFKDGMRYNHAGGGGGGFSRLMMANQMSIAETTIETSGMSAETETAGVQVNHVPKDGGNIFTGSVIIAYSNGSLQADNLTDELRARGLTSTSSLRKTYDGGGGLGGPIKKDKLWFYAAYRKWGAQENVAGNYYNKTPHTLFYTPDFSRPAFVDIFSEDVNGRLTWQASQKHKVTFSQSVQDNCHCFWTVDQNVAPEAAQLHHYLPLSLTQATWNYAVTSRFLVQAGATHMINGFNVQRPEGTTTSDIPVRELSTGYVYGAALALPYTNPRRYVNQDNGRFVVAYVTGSHAFKTGFTWFAGLSESPTTSQDSSVAYEFRKPTADSLPQPVSVTYYASPGYSKSRGNMFALYAQDQWTIRKLTLNLGVRLDSLHSWVPEQTRPAGLFVSEVHVAKIDNVPDWKDISPRLGVAYDLFGNGKTALKVSLGRYVQSEITSVANAVNPANAIVTAATRTWTDNGDYIPQPSELGPLSNRLFGTVVINTRYAPDVLTGWWVRPYNWSGSATLQHELRPGIGLTVDYFTRRYGNFRVTDNLRVTPADYDPYCITAPVDARLPGGGGNQICGLYDIKPGAFGQVDNLVTRASHYGKRTEVYNGGAVSISARFGRGGLFSGGVSTGQVVTDNCFTVDSPQQQRPGFCHTTNPFKGHTQVKFAGAYPLPWNLQASAVFQNVPGIPISGAPIFSGQTFGDPIEGGAYVATNAAIVPSLGRNLAACGARVPCNATATINLSSPYERFEDRLTQLDLRLTKIVPVGRVRVKGMFEVFNVLNASTILYMNTNFGSTGSSWLVPTQILGGRLFKFGAQLDF